MNEVAQALRQLADRIESDELLPQGAAERSAVLIATDELTQVSATYIGRQVPARDAGVFLAAEGIKRFALNQTPASASSTAGSSH